MSASLQPVYKHLLGKLKRWQAAIAGHEGGGDGGADACRARARGGRRASAANRPFLSHGTLFSIKRSQVAEMSSSRDVLIVDDDHAIRQLLSTLIKREGLSVDIAADGVEAIEKLRDHRYTIILLDLMMPRMDGFSVIENLARNLPQPKPIVFIISAYADQSFRRVDPSVVAGVIHKPFDIVELGMLIKHCVEGYDPASLDGRFSASVGRPYTSATLLRGDSGESQDH